MSGASSAAPVNRYNLPTEEFEKRFILIIKLLSIKNLIILFSTYFCRAKVAKRRHRKNQSSCSLFASFLETSLSRALVAASICSFKYRGQKNSLFTILQLLFFSTAQTTFVLFPLLKRMLALILTVPFYFEITVCVIIK